MRKEDLVKELSKDFREQTIKVQRNSQSKSKIISHYSQIINSSKKEHYNAIKKVNEIKYENEEL